MLSFVPWKTSRRWVAAVLLGLTGLTPCFGQVKSPWSPYFLSKLAGIPAIKGSPDLIKALYPDPSVCREVWELDAGKDAAGRVLKVLRVAYLTGDPDQDPQCDTCHLKADIWAAAISSDGAIEKRLMETDWFADRVDRGPESPGNVPGFQVGANSFTVTTLSSRGSWGSSTTWQLFPLKILTEHWEHHVPAGGADTHPPFFDASWDWRTLTGSGTQEVRRPCRQDNGPPGRFLIIPMLSLGDDFIQTSWKTVGLGKGALEVTGDNAFLLAGSRQPGLVMRMALASPTDLFVEIPKTSFTVNLADWLASDHLELWRAQDLGWDAEFSAVQWGIQLGDGQVFPAYGNPRPLPAVETAIRQVPGGSPVTIVHIRLSDPVDDFGFLTVSYSASDKGQRVASLLSTSQVCFGHGETLGLVKELDLASEGY